jgi:hypothetical protein
MDQKRSQINALVNAATRDLLRDEARTRQCSQGDLVEAALLAYCQPGATPETEGLLFARLLAIEETLAHVLGTLQVLVTLAEAQLKKPTPPKIASYDEMYGPIPAAADAGHEAAGEASQPQCRDYADTPAEATPTTWRWWRREEKA